MFNRRARFNLKGNRVLLFNYLKTYILLLLILCFTTVVIFSIMQSSLKEQIEKVNTVLLQNTLSVLEKEFEVIDEVASLINTNPKIITYLNNKSELSQPLADYTAYEIVRDLSNYIRGNSFIDDVYIFFDNKTVISGTYKANINFYSKHLDKYYFSGSDIISSYNFKNLLHEENQDDLLLCYANSLPLGNKSNPKATVIFKINVNRINEILNEGMTVDKTETVIYGSDNMAFFVYRKPGYIPDLKHIYNTSVYSPTLQWKISSFVPRLEYEAKLIALRSTIINILVGALIIGVLIALYFSYNNYRPIAKLMDMLHSNEPGVIDSNIFMHIENNISKAISENKNLKIKVDKQSELVANSIIEKIVKHEQNGLKDLEEMMDLSDIEFLSNEFIVCSIKLSVSHENRVDYVGIIEELRDLTLASQRGYVFYMNDANISILIEIMNKTGFSPKGFGENCIGILNRYNVSASAGISDMCHGIENINSAYKEALAALSIMPKEQGEVILYTTVQNLKTSPTKFYYPVSLEQEIINGVKGGNIEKVLECLEEVYNENFKEIQLSGQISKILINNVISTVIKTMSELKINLSSFEDANILDQLYNAETVNDVYRSILSVYTTICSVVNQNKKSSNVYLFEKIENFVNRECTNNEISLEYTANEFNLSSSYLSRFFKEQSGTNFNDYLQKLRIEKAKEIMSNNNNIMVQEVAQLVGYNSSGSLIRAFNKYEGVTPKEYQNNFL